MPIQLRISCGGFHATVGVYENIYCLAFLEGICLRLIYGNIVPKSLCEILIINIIQPKM